MKKITIILLIAMLAGCSSSKSETQPDEPAVEETNTEEATEAEEAEDVDLSTVIVRACEAFTAGDVEGTMTHFADDATWVPVGGPEAEGKTAVQDLLFKNMKGMMSDFAVAPKRIFVNEAENVVVYQGVAKGTNDGPVGDQPATGKKAGNDFAHIVWFDDEGKITKLHAISNDTTIPKMLGVMPTPKGQPPAAVSEWPDGDPEIVRASENSEGMAVLEATLEAAANGDVEAWANNFDPEVTGNNYGAHWMGYNKQMLVDWMSMVQKSFSDLEVDIHGKWAFGDYLVYYYTVKMKHTGPFGPLKATNKTVEATSLDLAKVEGDKIVWHDSYSNPMQMMSQLTPPKETAMKN